MRWLVRGATGLLLLAWLLGPPPVSAHAVLVASYPGDGSVLPAPPRAVHLWFSEAVELAGPAVVVTAPSGAVVSHGPIQSDGLEISVPISASAPGTYLVRWSVVSIDTHPSSGSFYFSVGRATGRERGAAGLPTGLLVQALARWLHEVGYALALGPLAFLVLVLRDPDPGSAPVRRLWLLVTAGIVALLLAEPVILLAQMVSLQEGAPLTPALMTAVLASSFGRVLAQRLGGALLLWALAGAARAGAGRALPGLFAVGAALALIDGESSHALSATQPLLALAATAIHMGAMSLWAGGLAALVVVWPLTTPARRPEMLVCFGRRAAAALVALALSGTVLALLHLSTPGDLLSTGYGRALAAKTLLLGFTLLLAAVTLRYAHTRRTRWWGLELATLLGILAVAALMVSLPPPR